MTTHDQIWEALMTAHSLIDDLMGLERNGIETGFKIAAIKRMNKENKEAFEALAGLAPDQQLPSPH